MRDPISVIVFVLKFLFQTLQAVTERISLGAEVVGRGRAPELTATSAAARWAGEEHSVSATLGSRGLDLCYARVLRPHLTAAAMLEVMCLAPPVIDCLLIDVVVVMV